MQNYGALTSLTALPQRPGSFHLQALLQPETHGGPQPAEL